MPELPEVETTAADLREQLIGQEITSVHVQWPGTIALPDVQQFTDRMRGQRIERVGRRGKYLVFSLDSGDTLLIHLRMTGQLRVEPKNSEALAGKHVRAWFDLGDGNHLVFTDQRKFGRIWLTGDLAEVLGRLGPEPLLAEFTPAVLAERLQRRKAPIKALLLDQRMVAGLGNIYADEALFLAKIHPQRPGSSLQQAEIEQLWEAIRQVLGEALAGRGTTLRNYRPPLSERGDYQQRLRVYGQTDRPCPCCGTPIHSIRLAQRSTHFCPHCQR